MAAPTTWPGTGEADDMLIRRYKLKARRDSRNADTQRALYLAWCREHAVHPAAQILS